MMKRTEHSKGTSMLAGITGHRSQSNRAVPFILSKQLSCLHPLNLKETDIGVVPNGRIHIAVKTNSRQRQSI